MSEVREAPIQQLVENHPNRLSDDLYKEVQHYMQTARPGELHSANIGERRSGGYNLPEMTLMDGGYRNPLSEREVLTRDVENAKRQFDRLKELAGVSKDPDAGFTQKHLDKVDAMPLTREQRDAVEFLRENFRKLGTRWIPGGSTGIDVYNPFVEKRITFDSLKDNAESATPTGRRIPDGKPSPYERNPEPADGFPRDAYDRRTDERTGRGRDPRDRANPEDVVVKEGWGWWQVTREHMRKSGIPYSPEAYQRELRRLQELNPGQVKMLHKGDVIHTR